MQTLKHTPRLIVLELTRRCSLRCIHCRASAQTSAEQNELATQEWFDLLDDISSFSRPIIILSGGEALLREDVFDIIRYGRERGLRMVIATCGMPLTQQTAHKLKQSGIKRVSVSIDGKDADTHDAMRGEKGIFDKAISATRILKSEGIEFQINATVTRGNVGQLGDILELAKKLGAVSFHPFFLVPVGRARELKEMQASPQQYEGALNWLYEQSKKESISCRPTCAPHYFRILAQDSHSHSSFGLDAKTSGCIGGKSFCFISSRGKVYPCGFLEAVCGDVKMDNFEKIWQQSIVFNCLRDMESYKGKCGECEYVRVCGGCRARAYEATGDYLEEEPECIYQPLSVRS